jgi:uncharacterized protein YlaN (UPF0358 family)
MTSINFKAALLKTFLLGGVFTYSVSSSYGMMTDEDKTSLPPSIIREGQKEFLEPSQQQIKEWHQNMHSLTIQDIKPLLEGAARENLISNYHLGWLAIQREKIHQPSAKMYKGQEPLFEKAKVFYWTVKAQGQDSRAQCEAGRAYCQGKGVERDPNKAFEYFRKAASGPIERINFGSCNLTDAEAADVATVLSQAKSLTGIGFANNKFTSRGLKPILAALQPLTKVKELYLSNNLIDDEGGKEILAFLKESPSLTRLKYLGNLISKEIEDEIKRRISLKEIDNLGRDGLFGDRGFRDEDIFQIIPLLRTQSIISLGGNRFTSQTLHPLLESLNSQSWLRIIDLSHNLIDDEGGKQLLSFFEENTHLKSICVYGNPMSNEVQREINKICIEKNLFDSEDGRKLVHFFDQYPSLKKIVGWEEKKEIENEIFQKVQHFLEYYKSQHNILKGLKFSWDPQNPSIFSVSRSRSGELFPGFRTSTSRSLPEILNILFSSLEEEAPFPQEQTHSSGFILSFGGFANLENTIRKFSDKLLSGLEKTVDKLHQAAWDKNYEKVGELVPIVGADCKKGYKGSHIDINMKTPLHVAVKNNDIPLIGALLEDQDVLSPPTVLYSYDSYGGTPFHAAAYDGHNEALEALLKRNPYGRLFVDGTQDRYPPIHFAAIEGHLKTVQLLNAFPTDIPPEKQEKYRKGLEVNRGSALTTAQHRRDNSNDGESKQKYEEIIQYLSENTYTSK